MAALRAAAFGRTHLLCKEGSYIPSPQPKDRSPGGGMAALRAAAAPNPFARRLANRVRSSQRRSQKD